MRDRLSRFSRFARVARPGSGNIGRDREAIGQPALASIFLPSELILQCKEQQACSQVGRLAAGQ